MYCTNCGVETIEGASFCQKCGAALMKRENISAAAENTSATAENISAVEENVLTAESAESISTVTESAENAPAETESAPTVKQNFYNALLSETETGENSWSPEPERNYSFADSIKASVEKSAEEKRDAAANSSKTPKSKKNKKEEKIYFGKAAFIFCLTVIGVLSCACVTLAVLYVNTL